MNFRKLFLIALLPAAITDAQHVSCNRAAQVQDAGFIGDDTFRQGRIEVRLHRREIQPVFFQLQPEGLADDRVRNQFSQIKQHRTGTPFCAVTEIL